VKKSLKLSLGSVVVAGALGAVLLPATSASATEGFVCPADTDTIAVPAAFAADGTPVLAGTVWTLFHILVITLQAFIFMMLTLIYLGQAHDAH